MMSVRSSEQDLAGQCFCGARESSRRAIPRSVLTLNQCLSRDKTSVASRTRECREGVKEGVSPT